MTTTTFTAAGMPAWTPTLVTDDKLGRRARAIVHELLGAAAPAVTFLPTLVRAGDLGIVCKTPAEAATGLALFAAARPITLADTARPDLNMRFIVAGEISQHTDTDTGVVLLSVPVQEVAA
ncbi:hypothetical protein [Leucobacter sp. GX0328]